MKFPALFLLTASIFSSFAVEISIDANAGRKPISPWIYGRNNNLSDNPKEAITSATWQLYKDAGLRMFRENGGNNCTKYNWRKKIGSHPDWYNNVYAHDWDYLAKSLLDNTSGTQALMGFQLLGWVAANTDNNFNDNAYNGSQWWTGVAQNLAGGGTVNPAGGPKALKEGDPGLYLTGWPADSTSAILDHWFGNGGLGYDQQRFVYWNMDNEPEIWFATHDDALPKNMTAQEFMQRFISVAKLARQKFPGIKLTGPIACNEWQWYSWNNAPIADTVNGVQKKLCWLEYFIKHIGEEQKSSGLRLLDVLDLHFYPGTDTSADLTMQLHRIWFDTTWVYPLANGCKLLNGNWDESIEKEYVWERCRAWLTKYIGPNHGVSFGLSETGSIHKADPSVVAVWYASHLGTFADQGVEVFTPWEWNIGQWEVLHLFSRYCGTVRVQSSSDLDSLVSAYSSINQAGDTLTILLVNRDRQGVRKTNVTVNNFVVNSGTASMLQLNDLPAAETFKSHSSNALAKGTVTPAGNGFSIDLPTVSVTAVILAGKGSPAAVAPAHVPAKEGRILLFNRGKTLFLNSAGTLARADISLFDGRGKVVRSWTRKNVSSETFSLKGLCPGRYVATCNGVAVPRQVIFLQ